MFRALLCTAWIISDPHEHSFSYTYRNLRMQRLRMIGTRKSHCAATHASSINGIRSERKLF